MLYVLHIGLPKCGSTSLQAFLAENAQRLLEQDVAYPCGPAWPHPRQHSWIIEALPHPGGRLTELLGQCRGHRLAILSAETMPNLSPEGIAALKARLQAEGGATGFKIILYVRNLGDMVLALAAEWVKIEGRPYEVTISHRSWSLDSLIRTYERAFGAAAVEVRLLENAKVLAQDFCTAAGVDWRDDFAIPPRLNVTADPLSSQLVQLLQTQFGADRRFQGLLQREHRLGRMENHYLERIARTLERVDLSHPKLAPFRPQLTAINWRDETADPALGDYVDRLILALIRMRQANAEPAATAAEPRPVDA